MLSELYAICYVNCKYDFKRNINLPGKHQK